MVRLHQTSRNLPPSCTFVLPEALIVFLEQVGPYALQVDGEQFFELISWFSVRFAVFLSKHYLLPERIVSLPFALRLLIS